MLISGISLTNFSSTGIEVQGPLGTLELTGSTVDGGLTGIYVNGGSLTMDSTVVQNATIFGVQVGSSGSAIITASELLNDGTAGLIVSSGNANVSGSKISGNNKGVLVNASGTATVTGSNLTVNTRALENATPTPVNASGNWWGSTVEATIASASTLLGLVDFSPYLASGDDLDGVLEDGTAVGFLADRSELYVTTLGSQVGPTGRIREGVDFVADGALTGGDRIVHLNAGTYVENVSVAKAVTILGAGQASTTVRPANADADVNANAVFGSLGPGASSVFLVQTHNVTIQGLTVDGNNPLLTSGILRNGVDVDARNGIITDYTLGVINDLEVRNVTVKNIYLRGIYASSGGTFEFYDNIVQNVAGSNASIGIFNFEGAGIIQGNTVSQANDAISSNWSTGVQFLNNIVSDSGSGIHTDNAQAADLIKGNTISNGSIVGGSYGIFVFAPYAVVTVENNTVTNVDAGISVFGSGGLAPVVAIKNNDIDLLNRPDSVGIWISTTLFGFGSANVAAAVTDDNEVTAAGTGILVEQEPGYTANVSITGNDNSIYANLIGIDVSGGSATITGNHIYDNTTGIRFRDGATGSVEDNNFNDTVDNGTDLRLDASAGAVSIDAGNLLAGDTYFIDNRSANTASLTAYTAANFETLDPTTLSDNFLIEDKMHHALDDAAAGLIRWRASELFVTTPGTGASDETIQHGVAAASSGDTVHVQQGTYLERIAFSGKSGVTVLGAGVGVTGSKIVGPYTSPANSATVSFGNSSGNTLDGFIITRDGNNATDWATNGMVYGVLFDAGSVGNTLQNSLLTDNRTAVDIRGGVGTNNNVIQDNTIIENRTGIIVWDGVQNNLFQRNLVNDNNTVGLLFLDTSGEATNNAFHNNSFAGNWYSQVEDRRATGAVRDLSGNWFGTNVISVTAAPAGEARLYGPDPGQVRGRNGRRAR